MGGRLEKGARAGKGGGRWDAGGGSLIGCRGFPHVEDGHGEFFPLFPWVPNVARRAVGASEAAETLGAAGGGGG